MAKHFFITLFLGSFLIAGIPLSASNEPISSLHKCAEIETCTAPPPTNFRVISRGPSSISLAWDPAWLGASHTISVFTKTASTSWVPFGTFYNISGSAYIINDMEFELECKVEIATNCDSGELSLESSKLQDKIIVELTTGGRIPVNPQTISCTDIPIPTSASGWIGFQVIKTGLIPQNIFEIKVVPIDPTTTKIQIKRVYENNVVYASDNQNFVPPPTLQVDNPFKMILRTLNNDLDIGKISVTKNTTTVNLCQFISDPPWNNAFNFIVMKSTIPNGMIAPSVFENTTNLQSPQFSDKPGFVNAQSPFCETLRVFFSEQSNYISQNATIRLLNSNGQIVMEEQIVPSFGQLSLPAQSIAPGIYFLQLEYEDETQTLKVVKIE